MDSSRPSVLPPFHHLAASLLSAALLWVAPAAAQGAAVLTGTVTDSATSRPLASVVVTAKSSSLQGEQVILTNESGVYRLANLPAGSYTLSLSYDGYQPYSRDGITLKTSQTRKVNVALVSVQTKAAADAPRTKSEASGSTGGSTGARGKSGGGAPQKKAPTP